MAEINSVVDEIAKSAQEQATGLQLINTAVKHMDESTQQNAAMVGETNTATNELGTEANKLTDYVGKFHFAQQPRELFGPLSKKSVAKANSNRSRSAA